MKALGIDEYRFSFAWPRIQPTGSGAASTAGLDSYDRLVDGLLEAGIEPTLFHWDTPQTLEDDNGWLNRDITDRFADRIKRWITLNEPVVVTLLGHALGTHAPGKSLGFGALSAAHHQLLAHGKSVQALWAASESGADTAAAAAYDMLHNRLFADPVLLGAWPGSGTADVDGVELPPDLPFAFLEIEGYERNDFGWPMIPAGFTEILVGLKATYGDRLPPVFITENGAAINDGSDEAGRVADQRRIDFLAGHLAAVKDAIDAGVDVRGYFQWSMMDNLEWAEGYAQRFGLVHVAFETQKRTPKDSFDWYRTLIDSHR